MLVGIGVLPNDMLARESGLACQDGIVVDRNAMTADPAIFAAGDCTRHIGREGIAIRLECVQNAIDQAKHAALAMLGRPKTYSEVPWFWSDQYDLKLQIAGLARPTDRRCCAAIRLPANSPSSICARARWRRWKRSMPRRNI